AAQGKGARMAAARDFRAPPATRHQRNPAHAGLGRVGAGAGQARPAKTLTGPGNRTAQMHSALPVTRCGPVFNLVRATWPLPVSRRTIQVSTRSAVNEWSAAVAPRFLLRVHDQSSHSP